VEMMNGVSTQTDGIKLRNRYTETLDCQLQSGLWSGKELDDEYLAAIESGIPESAAISLGYDRFIMALTSTNNIREVVLYPEIK
jgi:lysyl-tRNA synthetase class II